MFPSRANLVASKKHTGSMLVIAIFIMVVMALLGFAMIRLLSGSADAGVQQVFGLRAMNAAQSGLEAKIAQVFPLDSGGHDATQCPGTAINHDFLVRGLEDCSVSASCSVGYQDAEVRYYRFVGTGQCQAGEFTTSRTVSVDAKVEL